MPGLVGRHPEVREPGGGLRQETFLSGEVLCQLIPVTWNCATLLGALPRSSDQRERHVHKIDFAAGLALGNDVVMLQEVHGGAGDLAELDHRLPRHKVVGSFCASHAAGGIAVLICPRPLGIYSGEISQEVLEPGRAMRIILRGDGLHPISFCCVHIVPEWPLAAKKSFICRLSSALPGLGESMFLGGDLIFPAVGERRTDLRTGRTTFADTSLSLHFEGAFPELTDVVCDRPTRKQVVGDEIGIVSRIGRVFTNLPAGLLCERDACTTVLGKMFVQRGMGDHLPVRLHVGAKPAGERPCRGVPKWVARLPSFAANVADLSERGGISGFQAPLSELLSFKRVFALAATKSEAAAGPSDCDSPDSKLHWISKGKNAIRFSDRVLLEKLCCMFSGGGELFDVGRMCVSDPVRLQLVIAQMVRGDIDLQIQAVGNSDLEDTHKVQKKSKLQARLFCWSPRGKRVSGIAAHGPDGAPASSTDAAFGLLADHWSPVFNSGGGVPSAMEKFRKYVQPFPDTVEPVTREQFAS